MALKSILRISSESIYIQFVDSFSRIENSNIKNHSPEELIGFSDFNHSGDLLRARFNDDIANINYDVRYNTFGIVTGYSQEVQLDRFDMVRKAADVAKRKETALCILSYDVFERPLSSLTVVEQISLLCRIYNVVGGTIDAFGKRTTFEIPSGKGKIALKARKDFIEQLTEYQVQEAA